MEVRGENESKPNAPKALVMNEIDQERAEQTHREDLLTLQSLGVAGRPDSRKKQTDRGRLRPTLIWRQPSAISRQPSARKPVGPADRRRLMAVS